MYWTVITQNYCIYTYVIDKICTWADGMRCSQVLFLLFLIIISRTIIVEMAFTITTQDYTHNY